MNRELPRHLFTDDAVSQILVGVGYLMPIDIAHGLLHLSGDGDVGIEQG